MGFLKHLILKVQSMSQNYLSQIAVLKIDISILCLILKM